MRFLSLAELFQKPPAAYRPMIFWLWNGEMTPARIKTQIEDFAAKGCGGFFLHPMGEKFRLQDFLEGMSPPYLSDEFFVLVRYAVQTAQRYGLYVWLYDEGGWPSGTAQGNVVAGHPEFRGKRLHVHLLQETSVLPERMIAAVGLPEIGIPVPLDLPMLAQGLRPYDKIFVFYIKDDGYPVDVFNPSAVRRFIDVTHERYAEYVGEFFGDTIPGIFTDETSLGGQIGREAIPWSGGLLEQLSQKMGRDARIYLPLLFAPEHVGPDVMARYSAHEIVAARCEYYDLLTQRFADSYWQQISDWCEAHGLLHTGHVGGEDNLPDHLHFGHFFRTVGALQVPGVDVIWRQLFPGQKAFPFMRFAASAAKQNEKRPDLSPESEPSSKSSPWRHAVLTETNAVYGFGLHYGQMRWLLDYQMQHGVNLYAPMAYYATTSKGRLYGTMSHIGPGNPLWPYYRTFADYVGRVCLLARQSHEKASVAVYYPIETVWAQYGASEAWEALQKICEALGELHIPFDFIDADFLTTLNVNKEQCAKDLCYTTILIPPLSAIPVGALAKLAELQKKQAAIIFLEQWPLQPAEMQGLALFEELLQQIRLAGAKLIALAELHSLLSFQQFASWKLRKPAPELLISTRPLEEAEIIFLLNNSPRTMEPELEFSLNTPVALEVWDLRDGEILSVAGGREDQSIDFQPVLPPWSLMALVVRTEERQYSMPSLLSIPKRAAELERWLSDPAQRPEHSPPPCVVVAEFDTAEYVEVVRQYLITGGDIREAAPEERPVLKTGLPTPLRDWADWPLVNFSGEVRYTFKIILADELAHRQLLLDLGQVFWLAHIEINDKPVGDLLWPPYTLDVTGCLQAGENTIHVTVANTLANQASSPEAEEEARQQGWLNSYLARALPMMREDLRSGLYGPVRLLLIEDV